MPTYQYACTECGEQLEAVQSFSDSALTECPACQGKLRKVFNSVGIVFKGSGFYRNDSRPAEGGAEKNAGSEAKSEPAKTEAGKSDSSSSSASTGASTPSTSSSSSTSSTSSSSSGSGSSGSGSSGSGSSGSGSSGGAKAGAASS